MGNFFDEDEDMDDDLGFNGDHLNYVASGSAVREPSG